MENPGRRPGIGDAEARSGVELKQGQETMEMREETGTRPCSLLFGFEMNAAIFLQAIATTLATERTVLAVAGCLDLEGIEP